MACLIESCSPASFGDIKRLQKFKLASQADSEFFWRKWPLSWIRKDEQEVVNR